MIKLGVSAGLMYPDRGRLAFGHKQLTYFVHDMSQFLARPGVMPILIPDLPLVDLEPYLKEMDGFVFQGGVDVAPQTYGDPLIEEGRWPGDPHRDEYELGIMKWAFEHSKPMLGVCRGFQLMNVFFGGTLYQDLATETQTPVVHRDADKYDRNWHEVECPEASLLKKIYGKSKFVVNTVHHQGIKRLGKNLVVDAICPVDQIIEAFHYEASELDASSRPPFALGVQWHPEYLTPENPNMIDPLPLLHHFLEAIKK